MKQEIFDADKGKWFIIKRDWLGQIRLYEQIYTGVRKLPTGGEVVFSDCERLHIRPEPTRPPTPQPRS